MDEPRPIRVHGSGQLHHQTVTFQRFAPLPSVLKASLFIPPYESDIPEDLFGHHISQCPRPYTSNGGYRFVRFANPRQILIYTDGSCLDNGTVYARGGCAFVFKPWPTPTHQSTVAFAHEERGADDRIYKHTSNRAELRAVTAALGFRRWDGEGFNSLVIATDSEYTVKGITEWIETWASNGWRTPRGQIKNVDLWEELLELVNLQAEHGVEVLFWHIPRHLNYEADAQAKAAAGMEDRDEYYTEIMGAVSSPE